MKKNMNISKFAFAVLACALTLTIKASPPMASDNMMNGTNASSGSMMSDPMNTAKTPQMDNMASDKMHPMNPPQIGGMMSDNMMNAANPPQVGDKAPDFTLKTLDDQTVHLSDVTARSKVVLVELRGWPGYDCPFCTKQVHDYVSHADKLKAAGVHVLMVYPGPADDLKAHATGFLQDKNWPKDFLFVLDPDYSFTKSYGLRWDANNETAYPSTFIIDTENKVQFAHVAKGHDDRVSSAAVLKALQNGMDMKNDMPMKNNM
ncbi:MAG TPA: peroxiredoxin-like family protein [Methylomirabilota bacterium]|nr:peroxiredoxin-like family protein [Methylomirabilota bacterium]